jgi:hypothetical protein
MDNAFAHGFCLHNNRLGHMVQQSTLICRYRFIPIYQYTNIGISNTETIFYQYYQIDIPSHLKY